MQPFLSAASTLVSAAAATFLSSVLSGGQAVVSKLWRGREIREETKKKKIEFWLLCPLLRTFPKKKWFLELPTQLVPPSYNSREDLARLVSRIPLWSTGYMFYSPSFLPASHSTGKLEVSHLPFKSRCQLKCSYLHASVALTYLGKWCFLSFALQMQPREIHGHENISNSPWIFLFFFLISAKKTEFKDFSAGKSKSGGKWHAQPRVWTYYMQI